MRFSRLSFYCSHYWADIKRYHSIYVQYYPIGLMRPNNIDSFHTCQFAGVEKFNRIRLPKSRHPYLHPRWVWRASRCPVVNQSASSTETQTWQLTARIHSSTRHWCYYTFIIMLELHDGMQIILAFLQNSGPPHLLMSLKMATVQINPRTPKPRQPHSQHCCVAV